MNKKISPSVIRRLPRYYRHLSELISRDITKISSNELSKMLGATSSQIRQDLNCFGGFGQQGYGYNVKYLHEQIENILGINKRWTAIILGAGNLGKALANYTSISKYNYDIVGIFDNDKEKIGTIIGGKKVMSIGDLSRFLTDNEVDIGILAVPKSAVAELAETLAIHGVKGLWNFSFAELSTKHNVVIENVHMSDSLMALSYKVHSKSKQDA